MALRARLHFVDEVASTSTADVIDGSLLRPEALLLLQLLVEAEHGALASLHVACSAATCGIDEVGGRWCQFDTRGRPAGCLAVGDLVRLDAHGIASATTAGVDVGRADCRMRLGDVEIDHFDWLC